MVLRLLVYLVILLDLAAVLGVNLALWSIHLDDSARRWLMRFNTVAGALLTISLLLILFLCLFPGRKPPRPSRWPQEPPS